ncbi:GDSL-type esterase/lipase family protein [Paenibacillus lupini]|uniref:GDSL-type esterase/lipase family protein n=1 Tax=Paenibacillus lupini TaxID=1450204 RepID=UPI001FB8F8FA|nr:GDSL-type esterase/lipase family protein [Paenibacillus lupini]NIK26145.1 lysophospholipase L1-like esterase [Paenibacillus lupini]
MNKTAEGNELMKSDTVNTAVIPATKLEEDSYDWWERHDQVLKIKDEINPEIVLIGDSITHFWGGLPDSTTKHGEGQAWESVFGGRRVLNLGFGWDRTQNVLWRLDNGQMEGLSPEWVVINIGTNNTSGTDNARSSTAEEVRDGVRAIIERVRTYAPSARIILMAVFPREESPEDPRRKLIGQMNVLYAELAEELGVTFLNIGPSMLAADGTLPREIAFDTCHLTEQGYQLWADALRKVMGIESK